MKQVDQLRSDWEKEAEAKKTAAEKRKAKKDGQGAPDVEEEANLFDDQVGGNDNAPLFEDSDDDDDEDVGQNNSNPAAMNETVESNDNVGETTPAEEAQVSTEKELFGDSSSDESDEELIPTGTKRPNEQSADPDVATKKRRVMEDDDDE